MLRRPETRRHRSGYTIPEYPDLASRSGVNSASAWFGHSLECSLDASLEQQAQD